MLRSRSMLRQTLSTGPIRWKFKSEQRRDLGGTDTGNRRWFHARGSRMRNEFPLCGWRQQQALTRPPRNWGTQRGKGGQAEAQNGRSAFYFAPFRVSLVPRSAARGSAVRFSAAAFLARAVRSSAVMFLEHQTAELRSYFLRYSST